MPRGGRGGGGFRGGRSRPGTARIGGVEVAYDDELHSVLQGRPQPTQLFPDYHVNPPKPLSKEERLQIARFLSVRRRIRDGPLYAAASNSARVGKRPGKRTAAMQVDPFEGVETYSQRYTKKVRRLPRLEAMRYSPRCFPKELQMILQQPKARVNGLTLPRRPERKLQNGEKSKVDDAMEELEEDEEAPELVDEEAPEEEVDDEYATDEDDEGGDYNAEQYFDDGGDDGGGDEYDGGDAGGEDF